jgi:prepilin peptidase CpaA
MNPDVSLLTAAMATAVAAAVMDVQQNRIPNWLTYSTIVEGVLMRTYYYGWRGAMTALGGMILAAGLVFVFYKVNALGGGDLKLLAALGCLVGPQHVLNLLLATGIAGGILALIYSAYHGRIRTTVGNVGSVVRFHASAGLQSHPDLNLDNPKALRMPYGLAIAAGTLFALITL